MWTMFPTVDDFKIELYEKVMEYIKTHKKVKPLRYKYWNYEGKIDTTEQYKKATKYTYRHITNRNLCKIDGLKLNGNVSGLYGILMTCRHTTVDFETGDERFKVSTSFDVLGTVNPWLYGDITGIYGTIHPELTGDISGITGDITNIVGCCTGIKLNIRERIDKKTDIKMLLKNTKCFMKYHFKTSFINCCNQYVTLYGRVISGMDVYITYLEKKSKAALELETAYSRGA